MAGFRRISIFLCLTALAALATCFGSLESGDLRHDASAEAERGNGSGHDLAAKPAHNVFIRQASADFLPPSFVSATPALRAARRDAGSLLPFLPSRLAFPLPEPNPSPPRAPPCA